MNVKSRAVELRTCELTTDPGAVQKGADFVKAYTLGFDIPVCGETRGLMHVGCDCVVEAG